MASGDVVAGRCAAHPARPAADACPSCGRPRCAADRSAWGQRCAACHLAGSDAGRREVPPGEALVRAAVATLPVSLAGGAITSEYVGARVLDIVTPLLVGVVCGAVALAAAGRVRRHVRWVRAVGVLFAVLAVALGFRLVVGGDSPFTPAGQVLPPYVAAAAGAWLWTLPPRRRGAPRSPSAGER